MFRSHVHHRFSGSQYIGFILVVTAGLLLLVLSWLTYQHFTAPTNVAKLLPADDTFAFAVVVTDREQASAQQLAQFFQQIPATTLLDLEALRLAEPTEFTKLINRRVAMAFFGQQFDPQKFALIIDTQDRGAALEYFRGELLHGEELMEDSYRGTRIYAFPQSRSLVFAFVGSDLLVAANRDLLQEMLDARKGVALKSAPDYAAVSNFINTTDPIFFYLSKPAVAALALHNMAGLPAAAMGALLELPTSAAFSARPTSQGLVFNAALPVVSQFAGKEVLPVFSQGTATFTAAVKGEIFDWQFAGRGVATTLTEFLQKFAKDLPAANTISSSLDKKIQKLLGVRHTFTELVPVLDGEIFVASTTDDGFFLALKNTPELINRLDQSFRAGEGALTAGEEIFTLPDGSLGHRLVSGQTDFTTAPVGETTIVKNQQIAFANLGQFLFIGSDAEQVRRITERIIASGNVNSQITDQGLTGAVTLTADLRLPWLAPFGQLIFSVKSDPAALLFSGVMQLR